MGIIRDMLPILHRADITYVDQTQEDGDVVSFRFLRPQQLMWKAGQHGVFTFPGRKIEGRAYRVFSIASSSEEPMVRIATRIRDPISGFKRRLLALKEGDTIRMRGPLGPFYIHDPSRPVVLVAAGIGITPYLAILSDLRSKRRVLPESIDLIYGIWEDAFPFRAEIERRVDELPGLTRFPRVAPEDVDGCIDELASLRKNDSRYFLSGQVVALRSMKRRLRSQGIRRSRIRSDWFFGY